MAAAFMFRSFVGPNDPDLSPDEQWAAGCTADDQDRRSRAVHPSRLLAERAAARTPSAAPMPVGRRPEFDVTNCENALLTTCASVRLDVVRALSQERITTQLGGRSD